MTQAELEIIWDEVTALLGGGPGVYEKHVLEAEVEPADLVDRTMEEMFNREIPVSIGISTLGYGWRLRIERG